MSLCIIYIQQSPCRTLIQIIIQWLVEKQKKNKFENVFFSTWLNRRLNQIDLIDPNPAISGRLVEGALVDAVSMLQSAGQTTVSLPEQ